MCIWVRYKLVQQCTVIYKHFTHNSNKIVLKPSLKRALSKTNAVWQSDTSLSYIYPGYKIWLKYAFWGPFHQQFSSYELRKSYVKWWEMRTIYDENTLYDPWWNMPLGRWAKSQDSWNMLKKVKIQTNPQNEFALMLKRGKSAPFFTST